MYNYLVRNRPELFEDGAHAPRHDRVCLESFGHGLEGNWKARAWTLDDLDLLFLLDYDATENVCYVNVYIREMEFSVGGAYNVLR